MLPRHHQVDNNFGGTSASHVSSYTDGTELPPLPSNDFLDSNSSHNYEVMSHDHVWNNPSNYMGFSEYNTTTTVSVAPTTTTLMSSGYDPTGNGSYLGFDSSNFVHSPLFGQMPPVVSNADSFEALDLGSSSFFY